MSLLLALIASYALGSIPAAHIAGRSRGIDLRRHGSGNLGATNVFRVLGAKIGVAVFAFDMAKGAVPVMLFSTWIDPTVFRTIPGDPRVIAQIVCGLAAIAGHVRPMWLRFGKGGKGVATSAGVFIALAPIETSLVLLVFAVVVLASGFVSLGSLMAAVCLPVLLFIRRGAESPLFAVATLVTLFVIWAHRSNIGRLRRGEENRFGKPNVKRRPLAIVAIGGVVALTVFVAMRFR